MSNEAETHHHGDVVSMQRTGVAHRGYNCLFCLFPLLGMLSGLMKLVESNTDHPQVIRELLVVGLHCVLHLFDRV